MQTTLDVIFDKLNKYSGGDTPFTDMSDVGTIASDRTPEFSGLITTIESFKNREPENKMYSEIQTAFGAYLNNNPDKTIHFADITINMVVKPPKCEKSNTVVKSLLNKNEVSELEYFYRPILLLVMLLYMNHKKIPEDKFFSKSTGFFQRTRVTLYDHLLKKRDEQEGACKDLFQKLIDVYNFVYPVKSNLAIRTPAQEGARRTRYRKRKGKARARKTRRS